MPQNSTTSTRSPGPRRHGMGGAPDPAATAHVDPDDLTEPAADDAAVPEGGATGDDEPSRRPNIRQLYALLRTPFDIRSLMLTGIFVIALIFLLFFAQKVLVPITLAVILSFLLTPPVAWLHRIGMPEPVGAGLVLLVLLAVVGYGMYRITVPAIGWMETLPEQLEGIERKLKDISAPIERMTDAADEIDRVASGGVAAGDGEAVEDTQRPRSFMVFADDARRRRGETGADEEPIVSEAEDATEEAAESEGRPVQVEVRRPTFSETVMTEARGFLAGVVVVFILLYFLLASGDLFLTKLVKVQPNLKDKKRAVDIVRQIKSDMSIYLSTITLINIGLGIATGTAMFLMGMPNPALWGVMATLLNYIPYVGAIVGTAIVGLVALATFDEPRWVVLTPLVYWLLTALEGYLVTPFVLGKRLTLNPVVIFLGLVFWGWLWGIPGALLAVPLLAMFKILCDRIEPLQPIGEFLGR